MEALIIVIALIVVGVVHHKWVTIVVISALGFAFVGVLAGIIIAVVLYSYLIEPNKNEAISKSSGESSGNGS